MNSKPYKFHSNCVFVHGAKYSTLCDLYRLRYKSIPIELAKLLEELENKEPKEYYNFLKDDVEVFERFIVLLETEDYLHFVEPKLQDQWPKFETNYFTPNYISSAILYVMNFNNYNIENTIIKLSKLGCESISIIIKDASINFEELISIINKGSNNSSINIIDIYFNSKIHLTDEIVKILKENKRYTNFFFKSITNPDTIKQLPLYNFFENTELTNSISPQDFRVNPLIYCESLKYNTYYFKKMIINENGNIFF